MMISLTHWQREPQQQAWSLACSLPDLELNTDDVFVRWVPYGYYMKYITINMPHLSIFCKYLTKIIKQSKIPVFQSQLAGEWSGISPNRSRGLCEFSQTEWAGLGKEIVMKWLYEHGKMVFYIIIALGRLIGLTIAKSMEDVNWFIGLLCGSVTTFLLMFVILIIFGSFGRFFTK